MELTKLLNLIITLILILLLTSFILFYYSSLFTLIYLPLFNFMYRMLIMTVFIAKLTVKHHRMHKSAEDGALTNQ